MICDVVLDGFRDEYDFAIVRVREVACAPRVVAFIKASPIPTVVVKEGVREILEANGVEVPDEPSEGERLWLIATPVFSRLVEVALIDSAEHEEKLLMGAKRMCLGDDPASVFAQPDLFQALHDIVSRTVGERDFRVWDSGVYPAGEHLIIRYRAQLTAHSAEEAALLKAEKLIICKLDERGRRQTADVRVLEDAMVEGEHGLMARELTVSVEVPRESGTCCLWVWSRTLSAGAFRGLAAWMLNPRLNWFSMVSATPEVDPGYDEWAREQGLAEALADEREIEAPEGAPERADVAAADELAWGEDVSARAMEADDTSVSPERRADEAEFAAEDAELALPHLTVLIAEDPEDERGHAPTKLADLAAPSPLDALRPHRTNADLIRTISSLREQSFQDFDVVWVPAGRELGSAGTQDGSWRVVVGSGDVLEPSALERIACAAATEGTWLVYGDEDVYELSDERSLLYGGRLKLRFSLDELYWGNGVGLPLAVCPALDAPSAKSAYDLALAAVEQGGVEGVTQLEGVLVHAVRQRPFAIGASVASLQRHLDARGVAADVAYVETNVDDDPERVPGGFLRVRYLRPDPCPLVSIVIPNRNHADYLRPCVESILEKTAWPAYEVVIVENGSTDADILALYAELQERDPRVRVVSWKGKEFNYSAVVNRGVEKAKGEIVCLLNNDTKVLDGEWLDELVGPLSREEVGVTGALLTFEDGLVQHAGMVAVPSGGFGHMQQDLWPGEVGSAASEGADGYLLSLKRPVAYPMVTGACQVVHRDLFEELGGYDEALAVGFNDGDFCLRAAARGKETLFVPYARLWHREFGTRHRESDRKRETERGEREMALMHERYPELFTGDPFLNGLLDPESRYYRLDRPYPEKDF